MSSLIAKTFFPKLYAKFEKKKEDARNAPLSISDVNALLTIHFSGQPLYSSIDQFYSNEYKNALSSEITGERLEQITRFRSPSEEELNLLYCDIHAKDELIPYSGSNASD